MSTNNEYAVLGAAMNKPEIVPIVCGELEATDFVTEKAAVVFMAINALWKEGKPIDLILLQAEIEKQGYTDRAEWDVLLCDLLTYQMSPEHAREYIDLMHDTKKRRIFNSRMRTAIEMSESGDDGFIEEAQTTLDAINAVGSSKVVTLSDMLPHVANRLGDTTRGLQTGFGILDYVTGGFCAGHLIVIAARPGQGKTAIACNIAANMCRAGHTVAIFSLEMGAEEVAERINLSEAQVDKYEISKSAQKIKKVIDTQDSLTPWKMFIDDRASISTGQIISTSYKIKQTAKGLDCVFIDYLQLIRGQSRKSSSRNEQVADITRALKIMARELKCPVVALSQLNRNAEGRRPTIADLRESGAIEQDADIVLLLHKETETSTDASVIVGKNRHGRTGDIDFIWHPEYARFMEKVRFKETKVPKGVFKDE